MLPLIIAGISAAQNKRAENAAEAAQAEPVDAQGQFSDWRTRIDNASKQQFFNNAPGMGAMEWA